MKKLLSIIMCAAFALTAVSCNKGTDNNKRVALDRSDVRTSLLRKTINIGINNGSGDYSPKIDSPSIADVSISKATEKSTLIIEAKTNGSATILVVDLKTGYQAKCYLTIRDDIFTYTITDVKHAVDANTREADILADMQEHQPYPVNGQYHLRPTMPEPTTGTWDTTRSASEDNKLSEGTYSMIEPEGNIPNSYLLIWEQGMQLSEKWELTLIDNMNNGNVSVCHLLNIEAPAEGVADGQWRIYEDLTEHYSTLYPDAGVKGAARVYICDYSTN